MADHNLTPEQYKNVFDQLSWRRLGWRGTSVTQRIFLLLPDDLFSALMSK